MPRCIDADWITQNLEGWQDKLAETYGKNDEYVLCLGEVLTKIDDAPTEDVVEVVRCKDCVFCWKYNDKYYLPRKDTLLCINDNTEVGEDDFCSWGERRE